MHVKNRFVDGGVIINCPFLPVPLVGVGKLIIGSVFHTWMLKWAPGIIAAHGRCQGLRCEKVPDATSGGQQA